MSDALRGIALKHRGTRYAKLVTIVASTFTMQIPRHIAHIQIAFILTRHS